MRGKNKVHGRIAGYIAMGFLSAFATPALAEIIEADTPPTSSAVAKPCDPDEPEAGADGELIYTGCQLKRLGGTPPKLISGPEEPDLSGLYQRGIQGEVILSLVIGKDGLLRDVTVRTSSRSPDLDAIALDLIRRSSFSPAMDREGNPVGVRAILPTYFWKDSLMDGSLVSKTCKDFVIDAEWHEQAFPEDEPDKYRGWLLASGAIVAMFYGQGKVKELPKTPSYSEVMESCRKRPSKRFLDVAIGK